MLMNKQNIVIKITSQQLEVYDAGKLMQRYTISTAKNGVGQAEGSGCTPLGLHCISEKIGAGLPINSVFVAREFTGEIYTPALAKQYPNRDWILTRILWLAGCEASVNQGIASDGSCCDSKQRYIYIHGTPDTEAVGVPQSHGCIRMRNSDVITLFDWVHVGTPVNICV